MSREKALAKNTIIISIGTFLPKIATFITLPIVTATLSKTEYGTYDLITMLVSFFLPLVTLQVQAAAFRFLLEHRGDENKTKEVITNVIAFIIPTALLGLLVLFFALYKLNIVLRLMICIYFFLDILILTARQIVRGLAKNMLYSISAVVESISNMIFVVIILKFMNQGINGLLFSLIAATFMGLIVLIMKGSIITKIDFSLVSKNILKDIIGYSWPLIPTVMSDWILRLSDRIVITCFLGLKATAVYAIANKIPSMLTLAQNTFSYAWQENASLAVMDADEDVYYTHMFEMMSQILSGATAILIACTPILFSILIRGDYGQAYNQMPILLLSMWFSIFSSFLGGIYVAHKRTKNMGMTTLVAALLNLIIDLGLIKFIGLYAASISTLLSYLFLLVFRMYDILRFHKINYKLKNIFFYMFILFIMSYLYWHNTLYLNLTNGVIAILFSFIINRKIIIKICQILKKQWKSSIFA